MSAGKLLAGAVFVIGVIHLADRPEVQEFVRDVTADVSTSSSRGAWDPGPTMVSASRASNFRTSSHAPAEARVERALTPRVTTDLATLRAARDRARDWVDGAAHRYGAGTYAHREAWADYQRADAAYNAALERSGAW